MELVLIPAGEFWMGSSMTKDQLAKLFPGSEPEDFEAEYPPHRVRIENPFWIGNTEVTQEQWKRVMKTTPWKGEYDVKEGANYPTTYVCWDDAVEFCQN